LHRSRSYDTLAVGVFAGAGDILASHSWSAWVAAATSALISLSVPVHALAQTSGAAEAQSEAKVRDEIRRGFAAAGPSAARMMAVVRDVYPAEYAAFEDKLVHGTVDGTITTQVAEKLGYDFTRDLSHEHIPELVHASSDDLITIAAAELNVLKTLERTHVAACYEFGEDGGLSQARSEEIGEEARTAIASLVTAEFAGLKSANTAPETYAALTDAETETIGKRFAELGGETAWLTSLNDKAELGKLSAQTRCHSSVAFYEAATTGPREVAVKFVAAVFAPDPPK
jgi:hypothetical protein